jgi:hypothetical protein
MQARDPGLPPLNENALEGGMAWEAMLWLPNLAFVLSLLIAVPFAFRVSRSIAGDQAQHLTTVGAMAGFSRLGQRSSPRIKDH